MLKKNYEYYTAFFYFLHFFGLTYFFVWLFVCFFSFYVIASRTAPPRFTNKPPPLIFIKESGNLSVSISASGYPVPKITWSMQGKSYQNQTRFKTAGDKFVMDDVRFEDEGVITCRAENVFGVEETKVELTVLGEFIIPFYFPLLCKKEKTGITKKNQDIELSVVKLGRTNNWSLGQPVDVKQCNFQFYSKSFPAN